MTRPPAASIITAQARVSDRWVSRAAAATVAGLAGIADALSHMRQLAQDHGQAGWHAHAFPLSVDGIEISPRSCCPPAGGQHAGRAGCPGPR